VSRVFVHDRHGCPVLYRRFKDASKEGVDWVVTISHYILLKFFYCIACYGAVILSFNKGKLLFHCITIPYGGLYKLFILAVWIICLLHTNCTIWFL
jgi:hypothetical protein